MATLAWDDGRPFSTKENAGHEWWCDLPPGTVIRRIGSSARYLVHSMRDDFATVYRIRKDGQRDRRRLGWSGGLRVDLYEVLFPGEGEKR